MTHDFLVKLGFRQGYYGPQKEQGRAVWVNDETVNSYRLHIPGESFYRWLHICLADDDGPGTLHFSSFNPGSSQQMLTNPTEDEVTRLIKLLKREKDA